MKYYSVTANKKGRRSNTVIKAPTRELAMELAKSQKLGSIVKAVEVPAPFSVKLQEYYAQLNEQLMGGKKINMDDIIPAFQQMSMMLHAGLSIHQTLEDLIEFTGDDLLRQIFTEALSGINSGKTLTDSFIKYRPQLGNLTIAMIDLGEQTGNLADSLGMLAKTLEEIRDNIQKFKKALRYPLFTLFAMAIAFVILILLVVPKFKAIFEKMGTDLPMPTQFLLFAEYAMSNYGPYIIAGLVLLYAGIRNYYKKNREFHHLFDQKVLKVYLIGKIMYLSAMNQYMTALSQLIKAGIPLENGLRTASENIDNIHLQEKFSSISDNIRKGVSLTDAFRDTELFEKTAIQMVSAGEQSGNLDEMLGVAGNYYKMKYNQIVDNLSSYIEPLMTAFIAGMVLLLALGIFMPMWDIASAAKGH